MEKAEKTNTEENVQSSKNGFTEKVRENPWFLSTMVLGVLVLVLIIGGGLSGISGKITGNVISADNAGEKLLKFYEDGGATGLTVKDVKEVSGVYQVDFEYQGATVPIYVTKDGKYAGSLNAITSVNDSSTQTEDVPKTDKPTVELYVFTYCPYGLQMEKAILPVVSLLGNKIDFKIRQIGAMHGDFEKVEAERQLCIEKNYPDKFLSYVSAFALDTSIGDCDGAAACLTPKLNTLYTSLGIDAAKINSCITSDGVKMYDTEVANSNAKGVSGSPTLIINGVETSSGRTPDAIKTVVCSAFKKAPSECSQTLSTTSASAGFGASTSTTASSTASC